MPMCGRNLSGSSTANRKPFRSDNKKLQPVVAKSYVEKALCDRIGAQVRDPISE